jgi:hypothetical protein
VHLNLRPECQRSCLQPERAAQPPTMPSAATTVAAVAPLVLAALLHILLIVTGDIVRVGATAAAAVLAWRWRKRKTGAARTKPPLRQKMARRPDAIPGETARELPARLICTFRA